MKIIFMGTPALAVPCLDALARDHEILAVVTQPDKLGGRGGKQVFSSAVKKRAEEMDVPILQPERARDAAFVDELRALNPDAIAVVAYGQILPSEILSMAPRGCVNLHFSLLPRWRGAAPVQYAIWHGDKSTGVTTQWMAQKLDAGDIIQQREVAIDESETSGELLERLTSIGADVLSETFGLLQNGEAPRVPQNEIGITLCPQITREMAQIEWSMAAAQIINTVRAMNPWPVAWCEFRGEALKIFRASFVDESGEAGEVLRLEREGIVVACETGAVRLERVQFEGKARMNASDWARGVRLERGQKL